ncbi:hypothetical protein JTB14_028052 [Gonioctena quinquepunctata]|nr:hypothetical protein JTB14_028052 [Gonioctena quinquepunctata]
MKTPTKNKFSILNQAESDTEANDKNKKVKNFPIVIKGRIELTRNSLMKILKEPYETKRNPILTLIFTKSKEYLKALLQLSEQVEIDHHTFTHEQYAQENIGPGTVGRQTKKCA